MTVSPGIVLIDLHAVSHFIPYGFDDLHISKLLFLR